MKIKSGTAENALGTLKTIGGAATLVTAARAAHRTVGAMLRSSSSKENRPGKLLLPVRLLLAGGLTKTGFLMGGQGMVALGEGLEKAFAAGKALLAPQEEPITEEPIAEEPIAEEPIAEEPIAEEPITEEPITEEPIAEEPIAEEPVVEAMAAVAVTEPAAEESVEEGEEPDGALEYIDVMAEPERYRAMQDRADAGEVQLVTRYRRSYTARLCQSRETVQEYYNGIKNALFRYKGVKNRVSWGLESFNQGRTHVAKIDMKPSTLYLYLALNPAELGETKYEVKDVSDKKKFETVPLLIKVRGDRKYKYALELIDRLCGEQMMLPPNKKFAETDYRLPYQTVEELVEGGQIRMLVAEIPVQPEEA